jgi:hypothetical protein
MAARYSDVIGRGIYSASRISNCIPYVREAVTDHFREFDFKRHKPLVFRVTMTAASAGDSRSCGQMFSSAWPAPSAFAGVRFR